MEELCFFNRTFKVLSNLILLMVLCAGQVSAAPGNGIDDIISLKSSKPISGDLTSVSEHTRLDSNSFTRSLSLPNQITFTNTGSMSVARDLHTATLLNNGKVLVAGGFMVLCTIASAELYDPATGTWSTTGSMNVVR